MADDQERRRASERADEPALVIEFPRPPADADRQPLAIPARPEGVTPWGPGGLEHVVTEADVAPMSSLVLAFEAGVTQPTAVKMAEYAHGVGLCGEYGPADVAAVARAVGLGSPHKLLNGTTVWTPPRVRRRAIDMTLPRKVDGVIISLDVTDYTRPGYAVLTAHAFCRTWRMLIAARRVPDDDVLEAAIALIIEDLNALAGQAEQLRPAVLLAAGADLGGQIAPTAVGSEFGCLIEVRGGERSPGLSVPSLERDPTAPRLGGVPFRKLMEYGTDFQELRYLPMSCLSSRRRLVGVRWNDRYFISTTPRGIADDEREDVKRAIDDVRRWRGKCLVGASDSYGIPRFHAPKPQPFLRHYTILTVRDAYALFRSNMR